MVNISACSNAHGSPDNFHLIPQSAQEIILGFQHALSKRLSPGYAISREFRSTYALTRFHYVAYTALLQLSRVIPFVLNLGKKPQKKSKRLSKGEVRSKRICQEAETTTDCGLLASSSTSSSFSKSILCQWVLPLLQHRQGSHLMLVKTRLMLSDCMLWKLVGYKLPTLMCSRRD